MLESQKDNNKLSEKLQDLKCHERQTQNKLRDEFGLAYSKLIDIRSDLKIQIADTEKAKRWRNERKQHKQQYLQDKLATIKSPPKNKIKETEQEQQPAADSNVQGIS